MSPFRVPRQRIGPPPEAPGWVRSFRAEDWATPDRQEREIANGMVLGDEHREWHRRRRWCQARLSWLAEHPEVDALALLLDA